LRDRFAETGGAEPEALAHHFTQAGMTDAAIEWWGKAGDQALRRSAFQEAISHLGKAIEMADVPETGHRVPHSAAALRRGSQRLQLQGAYGNALLQARGMQSPETQSAFRRARELADGGDDPVQRFSTYYGLWAGHFVRGDLPAMQEIAGLVLHEIEDRPTSLEAVVAYRLNGATQHFAGNFAAANAFIERSLGIFDPRRRGDEGLRFAQDIGVTVTAYLALVLWPLGAIDRARAVAEETMGRATQVGHPSTLAYAHFHLAIFEMMRRSFGAAAAHIEGLVNVSRAHEMEMWTAYGEFLLPWTRRGRNSFAATLAEMRRGVRTCREQALGNYIPFFNAVLAETEAEAGELESALATIDNAIAEIERGGQRRFAAESYRIRGEILLKPDPANTTPAEEAFLTPISVAQQQKARSFELRAALSLAKLYQSADRAADAHAVLAPALEGFSPTPEFAEVEEAQRLLAGLAETDEVKNAAAARQRRLKLQTSYGKAMMLSRGFASEESKAAFTRAHELGAQIGGADERFDTYYGLYISQSLRGEAEPAHETAEAFLRDARSEGRKTELAAANRIVGMSFLSQGALEDAQAHLSEALRLYDPERDRDAKFRFGADTGAAAAATSRRQHGIWARSTMRLSWSKNRAAAPVNPATLRRSR
jgi:predicted ATPase